MHDQPDPDELLRAVADFLREQAVPATAGQVSFHARVAANALESRGGRWRWRRKPTRANRPGCGRLLCDAEADVAQLNRMLCERIASGAMISTRPAWSERLWQVTLDKLAVDQPGYETYRARTRRGRTRRQGATMNFDLPADLVAYLAELDDFIAREIAPLQAQDDNERFFDHRREWARTDFDNDGPAAPRMGSAAGRGAPPRRPRRPSALRPAARIRRARRQQPVDGGDPRAPRGQGPGPAQRPAERALDRRQQPASCW